jgi:hypothetical protein
MNNAKIWILLTGIVVIVSGFVLYSLVRAKEAERAKFMVTIQELNSRVADLDRTKEELEQVKKERAELEVRFESEVSSLESQVADSKKAEALIKSRVDTMVKDREAMTKSIENYNAIIAKLNKKIETLEKERDQAIADAEKGGGYDPGPRFVDPMMEQSGPGSTEGTPPAANRPAMGAKLAEEEIVDLGRVIVHPATNEAARVEHVNPLYGFIVMSAGTADGIGKDSVVNITRNNRLIAKAVVKKAREDVASAVTLPEWTREEIRVGDLISINTPSPLTAG